MTATATPGSAPDPQADSKERGADAMKVLFLSQRVPYPPDRGDRITTHHFLEHLIAAGAEVRIGCLADEDQDAGSVSHLRSRVQEVCAPRIHPGTVHKLASLRALLSGESQTTVFFRNAELQATVDRWIDESRPDLVYVYSSSMAQYVLHHHELRRFMQFAELDSDKWRQFGENSRWPLSWLYRREARKLLEFESEVARAFTHSAVVSEVEKELFMQRIPGVTPLVLPNGVDVEHFKSAGDAKRDPHTVVFTGVMDYEPNTQGVLWFLRECWPRIRAEIDDARFLIVGSRPIDSILQLDGIDGVEVTGRVAEIPPYLDSAAVAVAPLHMARGVQNKVLEAMSSALPVVASPQAAQGLGETDRDTLIVETTAEATATAILELLKDPAAARAIGQRAAEYVRAQFRWENMFAIFDRAILTANPEGLEISDDTGTAPVP